MLNGYCVITTQNCIGTWNCSASEEGNWCNELPPHHNWGWQKCCAGKWIVDNENPGIPC